MLATLRYERAAFRRPNYGCCIPVIVRFKRRASAATALIFAIALFASCSTPEPNLPPSTSEPGISDRGIELAAVDGVARVLSGTNANLPPGSVNLELAPPMMAPDGVVAIGTGIDASTTSQLDGMVQIRLVLPPQPFEGSIPGVIHVTDSGTTVLEAGLWDNVGNEVVVLASSFSFRYPVWFDPRKWVRSSGSGLLSIWDFIADFATGRTEPPACRRNSLDWAATETEELSSLHVCVQPNPNAAGVARVEVLLKSNRRTFQLVTIPATTKDYLWVQDQPTALRDFLPTLAAVDPDTNVLLIGGTSMSMGFLQPQQTTEAEIRSYLTPPVVLLNAVTGILGGDLGPEATAILAPISAECVEQVAGTSGYTLDFVPTDLEDFRAYVTAGVTCILDAVENPEIGAAVVDEARRILGLATTPSQTQSTQQALQRLKPIARVVGLALSVVSATTVSWDGIFDGLAEGRLMIRLKGSESANSSRDNLIRIRELNELCRGGPPAGVDPATDRACSDRDDLLDVEARRVAADFLDAWRDRDSERMRRLSTTDASDTFGGPLVDSLLNLQPAEQEFEVLNSSGDVSAYITTTDGVSQYFQFDFSFDSGWKVSRFAPDVG